MDVAIVCDYLNVYGGAERTLEAILEILPDAAVFTSLYEPSKFRTGSPIRKSRVVPFFPSYLSLVTSHFLKHLTFLMPFFFERLDLSGYDLIISLGTIWAKGVRTQPGQKHVFYCLTPPRFLYGYPSETSKRNVWYYRPFTAVIDHWLRIWDFNAAQKPSRIVVISQEIQGRVKKFYRRDSTVIYPPAALDAQHLRAGPPVEVGIKNQESRIKSGDYFLIVSRLSAYKGIDAAIKACDELKLPLKIVGTGREEGRLKAAAASLDSIEPRRSPTVEFLGFRSDEEVDELYRHARALIFPTPDEDFGLVPLEANAHGVPVIAHRSGGPLETMVEGGTAVFFKDINELKEALKNFDESKFDPNLCIGNAQRFSKERFQKEFKEFVGRVVMPHE